MEKDVEAEGTEQGVEQIIYVTYQDPDDPTAARTLHIVDSSADTFPVSLYWLC